MKYFYRKEIRILLMCNAKTLSQSPEPRTEMRLLGVKPLKDSPAAWTGKPQADVQVRGVGSGDTGSLL